VGVRVQERLCIGEAFDKHVTAAGFCGDQRKAEEEVKEKADKSVQGGKWD